MKLRLGAALAVAASLVLISSPARADYVVKDGNGVFQTMKSFLAGLIHHPGHVVEGLSAGVPAAVTMTNAGALDVTVIAHPAVTQPTAANLNATVVGTGTFSTQVTALPALPTGANTIGSIANTGFNVTGTLPAFTLTPTFNCGTGCAGSGVVTAVAGGFVDGALATEGLKADTACATGATACTMNGRLSKIETQLEDITTPQPVKIDQTTPGTTNAVQDAATSATGSAVPAKAIYAGANSSGSLTGLIQADSSQPINVVTATTTQLVALSAAKKIYVTNLNVVAAGTGNITFEYGTGVACATGTTILTGAYSLTAQAGLVVGTGLSPVLVVPASNALCILTSAAVQMSGSVAYTQF